MFIDLLLLVHVICSFGSLVYTLLEIGFQLEATRGETNNDLRLCLIKVKMMMERKENFKKVVVIFFYTF